MFTRLKTAGLKLQLAQRFLFLHFKPLIKAYYKGTVQNGCTYFPLVAMLVDDQPEERTLLSLKRRDSDMDCTHCMLRSRIGGTQHRHQTQVVSSSSDEHVTAPRRHCSVCNTVGKLSFIRTCERATCGTVHHQLFVSLHSFHRHLEANQFADVRCHLVGHSAQYFPSALSYFAGLRSTAYSMYRIISFDKLHVLNLGIICEFCDMTNTFLQHASLLPLSPS